MEAFFVFHPAWGLMCYCINVNVGFQLFMDVGVVCPSLGFLSLGYLFAFKVTFGSCML